MSLYWIRIDLRRQHGDGNAKCPNCDRSCELVFRAPMRTMFPLGLSRALWQLCRIIVALGIQISSDLSFSAYCSLRSTLVSYQYFSCICSHHLFLTCKKIRRAVTVPIALISSVLCLKWSDDLVILLPDPRFEHWMKAHEITYVPVGWMGL